MRKKVSEWMYKMERYPVFTICCLMAEPLKSDAYWEKKNDIVADTFFAVQAVRRKIRRQNRENL